MISDVIAHPFYKDKKPGLLSGFRLQILNKLNLLVMHGSRKFCQRGSNFDNVFLVDEGWVDPNSTISISGLSLARQ